MGVGWRVEAGRCSTPGDAARLSWPGAPGGGLIAPGSRDRLNYVATPLNSEMVQAAASPAFLLDTSNRILAVSLGLSERLGIDGRAVLGEPCTVICSGTGDGADCFGCPLPPLSRAPLTRASVEVNLLSGAGDPGPARLGGIAWGGDLLVVIDEVAELTRSAVVDICCLGQFSATFSNGEAVRTRRPKALALLKVLLVTRGRPMEEARLVRTLWPGGAPQRGLRALRVLVHDIRYALEPGLESGGRSRFVVRSSASYLVPDDAPLETDVDRFLAAASVIHGAAVAVDLAAATQRVRRAIELYRGDLYAADPAADWFAARRKQLRNVWLDVLTLDAALLDRAGDRKGAISACQRVIDADILREDAQRMLLLFVARDRGRDAALREFVAMSDAVKTSIGLPLSRETSELSQALLDGEEFDDLEARFLPWHIRAEPSPSRTDDR